MSDLNWIIGSLDNEPPFPMKCVICSNNHRVLISQKHLIGVKSDVSALLFQQVVILKRMTLKSCSHSFTLVHHDIAKFDNLERVQQLKIDFR